MLILHLEDDPDIRMITRFALEEIGDHEIVQCENGVAGIEAIEAGLVPDLYLIDVMMPDMDGEEFIAIVRSRSDWPQPPIIFMTARAQDTQLVALKETWKAGVIVKPVDPIKLSDRIDEILPTLVR